MYNTQHLSIRTGKTPACAIFLNIYHALILRAALTKRIFFTATVIHSLNQNRYLFSTRNVQTVCTCYTCIIWILTMASPSSAFKIYNQLHVENDVNVSMQRVVEPMHSMKHAKM